MLEMQRRPVCQPEATRDTCDLSTVRATPQQRLWSYLQRLTYVVLGVVLFLGTGLVVLLLVLFGEAMNATPCSGVLRVATLDLMFAICLTSILWALSRLKKGVLQFSTRSSFVGQLRELEVLSLACDKLTDSSLAPLSGLSQLREIDLGQTPIGDAGLSYLGDCRQLQVLRLNGTRITDQGLAHLQTFRQLQILDLGDTTVTGNGLGYLCDLSQLRQVVFQSTALNAAELQHLRSVFLALATSMW